MKKLFYILPGILLAACGGSDEGGAGNGGYLDGTFIATLADMKIETPVTCGNFNDDDAFFFNSDNGMAVEDIDGDGFIIAGSRVKIEADFLPVPIDTMRLELTVNGAIYTVPPQMPGQAPNQIWTKIDKRVSGSGRMLKEGGGAMDYSITYEVICE